MSIGGSLQRDGLRPVHWLGIVFAAVTGVVHLALGVMALPSLLGVASVGAFGGFVLGIVLVLWGVRPWWLYLCGIPFVGAQILLWYLLNEPQNVDDISALAAVDKSVQLLLLAVLAVLVLRTRQGAYETTRGNDESQHGETNANRGEP